MTESLRSLRKKIGSLISQDSTPHLMPPDVPIICVTSESDENLGMLRRSTELSGPTRKESSNYRYSLGTGNGTSHVIRSDTSNDTNNAIINGTSNGNGNISSTLSNDQYFFRKMSSQFDAALEDQDENENLAKGTRGSLYPESPFTSKNTFQIRRGVTGSISVPINKMSLKLYGSEKAVVDEQNRLQQAGRWIIHPYSNFRLMWDSMTLILLLINIILIPVAIAFWKDDESYWLPFKYVTDVWFLLDIFFNFRTGIVIDGPDSDVILDPIEIRTMYLKTWFAIDLISTFPFDLIFTLIIFNFQYEIALAFARIFNQIMTMLFICHFNGCLQYMVPMFLNFPEKTWVRDRNLHNINVTVWERYSWSVFKSTSHMLCIGYGQFPPQGLVDVWVTYVSMLSGAMCFALFIGNATSLIQSMDASKRAYKEKFMQVKEYMQFRKLPPHLRRKISDYYENRFQGKMFDESKILSELNHNLREEIINSNCRDLLEQVPLFNEADPYFINAILSRLQFEVFLMDEPIVKEGSVGNKMYFISRGTVTIKSAQHNIEQSLSDGCYFGEIALLQPNLRRVASVIAETYCYLYSLSAYDFDDVLEEFPMQRVRLNHFTYTRSGDNRLSSDEYSSNTGSGEDGRSMEVRNSLGEIREESSTMFDEDD